MTMIRQGWRLYSDICSADEDKYDEVGEKWYALNHDDNYLNHDAHSVNCRDYDGHGRNSKSSWREKLQ